MARRRFAPGQKMVIITEAILSRAPAAAEKYGLSEHTIWKGCEEAGGLRAMREYWDTRSAGAYSEMATALVDELKKRLPKMTEKYVVALSGLMIQKSQPATVVAETGAPASMGQSVHLHFGDNVIEGEMAQRAASRALLEKFGDNPVREN